MNKLSLLSKLTISSLVATFASISAPALAFSIRFTPPPFLVLDGQQINEGIFNVTSAEAFFSEDDNIETISIIPPQDEFSQSFIIGSVDSEILFEAPDNTEVLRMSGFFEPTDPELPNANFDILVGEFAPIIPSDFTVFLPVLTNTSSFQITDLGLDSSLNDNTDVFSDTEPVLTMLETDPDLNGLTVIELNNGVNQWFVGYTPSSVQMADHGTATAVSVPEPSIIFGVLSISGLSLGLKRKKQS